MTKRTDYCGRLSSDDIGRTVTVCGWVSKRREHGEFLAFVDLSDRTGIVQCVVDHAHDIRGGVDRKRTRGHDIAPDVELPGHADVGQRHHHAAAGRLQHQVHGGGRLQLDSLQDPVEGMALLAVPGM